jgi:methylated-DNA-protein-cysteine methyltransferase-like protein
MADAFNRLVWAIVRQIPAGRVATYGQIASMLPVPADTTAADFARLGPRRVGEAMNAVSALDDPAVPWHRVINAQGGISLPPDSRAGQLQRKRLEAEGVIFGPRGTCDLSRCGWDGPPADFLAEHGLSAPKPTAKKTDGGGQLPLL